MLWARLRGPPGFLENKEENLLKAWGLWQVLRDPYPNNPTGDSVTYCIDSWFFSGCRMTWHIFTGAAMTFIHEDWSILDERQVFRSFEMWHVGMLTCHWSCVLKKGCQSFWRADLCMMRLQCLCEWRRWIPSRHGWTSVEKMLSGSNETDFSRVLVLLPGSLTARSWK